ncbi:MAG: Rpn family recombination-promoting nuclease/putative transposase [Magnetococcales bacterium]|nr:Rpn family recombination-promoting nuclease/putative transposase [Magnetococcales bacterium]
MNPHDLGYNKLFSQAQMVQDLINGFIREDWTKGLDFFTLEKVNPVYVSDDFRKRIDDLVWKIRWQGTDRWLYIYLILEPQSTVDDLMALRTDLYTKLLYQDLRQSGKIPHGQKFPPVAPIVLYNGKSRWTAAMDVADLIEEYPPGLEICRPRMRYLLIDAHHYQNDVLSSMHNVVAALFRLEKSRTLEDVRQVVHELDTWLKSPEQKELRRAFASWLGQILLPRLSKTNPAIPETIPEMNDLKEVHTMLAETAERWTREWKQEGLDEGLQKGNATALLRILRRRLSNLPTWVEPKVHAANLDTLDKWIDRAIDARTWQDVFDDDAASEISE